MRPDDRRSAFDELMDPGMDLPFDAALESLDDELTAAGQHARRMLYGRTQPTRLFTNQLRAHLLDSSGGAAAAPGAHAMVPGPADAPARQTRLASGPAPALAEHGDANDRRPMPALPMRTLLAMLAVAGMAAVLGLGALSGSFGPALP